MLSTGPGHVLDGGRRHRALVGLLWPSSRHVRLSRVGVTVAVGGVPLAVHTVVGGPPSRLPVAVLAVAAGAAIGWAVDDPGAELLAACPVGSARRTQLRVLLAAATAAVAFLVIAGSASAWGNAAFVESARLPEAAAAAAMGLAAGLFAWKRGDPYGGATAVCAGFVAPFVITALSFRWPDALPTLAAANPRNRWWLVAVAAAAIAADAGRDPGSRRRLVAVNNLDGAQTA